MSTTAYITNAGLAILAARVKGQGTEPKYLAWGTGAGVAAPGDTALFTEASETRVAMASQLITVTQTGDSYKLTGSIIADAEKTITNWGVFDAATGGNLLLHVSESAGVDFLASQLGAFTFRLQFLRGD